MKNPEPMAWAGSAGPRQRTEGRTQGVVKFPVTRRREFVRAFVDQAWARPGTDRPIARVHVAVMVTTGVLVAAVLTGVVLQLIRPVPLAKPAPPPPTVPATFTAVSGWDCTTGADRGFDATGRTSAWYTVARGGWATDGCHGTFEAIPLSGDAHKYDQNQAAVWWFAPGQALSRCELAIYNPDGEQPTDSAATDAQFAVLDGRNGQQFASFVIDQTRDRGTWKVVGTFPTSQGGLAVRLVNSGVPSSPRARLAVAQVRATCTGGL
jgi:hypothetical protein